MYILNYSIKKDILINSIGDYSDKYDLIKILSSLLSDKKIFISNFCNLEYTKEIDKLSIQIRDSFYLNFTQNLINNLSYQLTEEKGKILDCSIKESCAVIAEEEINNFLKNTGYNESISILYAIFHKKLIVRLFDNIAYDLGNNNYLKI